MISSSVETVTVKEVERLKSSGNLLAIFTAAELNYCWRFKNSKVRLAGKLAAKKAFLNAVKHSGISVPFGEIPVRNSPSGRPAISNNHLRSLLPGHKIALSISHTDKLAAAICLVYPDDFDSRKKTRDT